MDVRTLPVGICLLHLTWIYHVSKEEPVNRQSSTIRPRRRMVDDNLSLVSVFQCIDSGIPIMQVRCSNVETLRNRQSATQPAIPFHSVAVSLASDGSILSVLAHDRFIRVRSSVAMMSELVRDQAPTIVKFHRHTYNVRCVTWLKIISIRVKYY